MADLLNRRSSEGDEARRESQHHEGGADDVDVEVFPGVTEVQRGGDQEEWCQDNRRWLPERQPGRHARHPQANHRQHRKCPPGRLHYPGGRVVRISHSADLADGPDFPMCRALDEPDCHRGRCDVSGERRIVEPWWVQITLDEDVGGRPRDEPFVRMIRIGHRGIDVPKEQNERPGTEQHQSGRGEADCVARGPVRWPPRLPARRCTLVSGRRIHHAVTSPGVFNVAPWLQAAIQVAPRLAPAARGGR